MLLGLRDVACELDPLAAERLETLTIVPPANDDQPLCGHSGAAAAGTDDPCKLTASCYWLTNRTGAPGAAQYTRPAKPVLL